ncbi:C-type lectin mannose-binding isoform [Bagarius yarrelli]|uniref:C-type lectin mannose-binding isoform n=1 Tax=Bagarius yarrelli TaxID=175774 RepID=A0A556V8K6_BAGYA|nr:C-type lectin mannose-binding isoform [Bagarius yarrelli]
MNWTAAQSYCKANYTNLAVIATREENLKVREIANNLRTTFWIGMNRTAKLSETWQWCNREPTGIYNWRVNEPNNNLDNEDCVSVTTSGWNDSPCSSTSDFLCDWNIIFVQEIMTWEEALKYCKTYYKGMASLSTETKMTLAESETAQSGTARVWTGLRFLDGKWFWLSNEQIDSQVSVSECPALQYHCGARNVMKNMWENRHCNDRLSFFCYTK